MSSNAVLPAGYHLRKPITAKTHGLIDYAHAAFFFGVALCCRKRNKRAATAAAATGTFILVQSLLTDYPLGAKPVLTFNQHGKLDAAFAASSLLVPTLCGFSDTKAGNIFRVNSFVEATVVALTDWDSAKASNQARESDDAGWRYASF